MTTDPNDPAAAINADLRLHRIFASGSRLSLKVDSYFQVYERLLQPFVGRPVVFVEVGILHGGSLFMWREYLGAQARIVGVDFNPQARQWEKEGFEIHIGDQSDPAFWDAFYRAVGPVDVLLDDGGHTNAQQIVTAVKGFEHVNDGGLVIVEDVHASFMREFGNPSRHSFHRFAAFVAESVHRRYHRVARTRFDHWRRVYAVAMYESIVAFEIDARRCWVGQTVSNGGVGNQAVDYRQRGISGLVADLEAATAGLGRVVLLKSVRKRVLRALYELANRVNDARLARYFR